MSTFNSSSNFLQGLQGLFGSAQQQNRGAAGQDNATNSPFVNWRGMPTLGPERDSPQFGYNNPNVVGDLRANTLFRSGTQPGAMGNMTYGQAMGGALARDYQNAENARQRELGMYQGLFGNIMGSMAGGGQMVQDARGMAGQNMAGMEQQAGRMREAGAEGDKYFGEARDQMLRGLDEARGRFDASIQTAKDSRAGFDASWMGDAASNRAGLQADYVNRESAIKMNDSLTEEQKGMMLDQLRQDKSMQASQIQASATSKARDTLIALDQNIAQLQAMAGGTLGQLGVGVGQAIGSLGMQNAAQKQQIETQIGSFYNNMLQFNSSLLQSAQANALQHTLNGNQLAASLVSEMPFGPMSIFETLTRMVSAGDYRRNQQVSPEMGALFGRMA